MADDSRKSMTPADDEDDNDENRKVQVTIKVGIDSWNATVAVRGPGVPARSRSVINTIITHMFGFERESCRLLPLPCHATRTGSSQVAKLRGIFFNKDNSRW